MDGEQFFRDLERRYWETDKRAWFGYKFYKILYRTTDLFWVDLYMKSYLRLFKNRFLFIRKIGYLMWYIDCLRLSDDDDLKEMGLHPIRDLEAEE